MCFNYKTDVYCNTFEFILYILQYYLILRHIWILDLPCLPEHLLDCLFMVLYYIPIQVKIIFKGVTVSSDVYKRAMVTQCIYLFKYIHGNYSFTFK